MARRYYRNGPSVTLSASIGASDTSIQVSSASGFPTLYPYTLILDLNQGVEEVVEVSSAAGTTLTVTRGVDGTTGFPHSSGAVIVHGISARDADEANLHVNSNAAVHGVTGALVGTTDTQTLTNKTLSSATINSSTLSSPAISGGTIGGTTIRDTTIFQGNGANSQNPASIRTVAGVEVGLIGRDGRIQVPRLEATSTDVAVTPLAVTGIASQSANLMNVRTDGGAPGIEVAASGRVGLGRSPSASGVTVLTRSIVSTDVALRVQKIASQTGAAFDYVNEDGSVSLYRIDADGRRVSPNWINASLTGARQPLDNLPQYRRYDGFVELRGTVGFNPTADMPDGAQLFQLPVGFRPVQLVRVACGISLEGGPSTGASRVDVGTDGWVSVRSQEGPRWVLMDGVRFAID
jgi:hypothetical protein